jgi:hypothetical protein
MLHYLFVGHFAHQGNFIRFNKLADGSLRPAVERSLSMDIIQKTLDKRGLSASSIPEAWGLWLEDGFIVCDAVTDNRQAIEFIRDLAQETECDLADYSSQSLWTPSEWAREPPIQPPNGSVHDNRVEPATK